MGFLSSWSHLRYGIVFIVLQFPSMLVANSHITMLNEVFRSLDSVATEVDLRQYNGTPVVMVLFEPDCPWCFKQVKSMNRHYSACGQQFQPLAIGVNGNRKKLKQEVQRFGAKFPSLQASTQFLQKLGNIPGTPLMLVVDENGNYSGHYRGYQNDDKLNKLLRNHGIECDAHK